MWRNLASTALTAFVVILFVLGGVVLWGKDQYGAKGPLSAAICLKVERGETMGGVSRDLVAQGAVRNGAILRIGAQYTKKSQALKAGSFLVPEGASMAEIVDIVTRGGQSTCGTEILYRIGVLKNRLQLRELDPATNRYVEVAVFDPAEGDAPAPYQAARKAGDARYRVALAEGITSWRVVQALKAVDFLSGAVVKTPAEGSLAPDSYELSAGDSRADLIGRMQAKQSAILAEAWKNRAEGLPFKTPEEALVLASIVEKETGVAEERRRVASVFINRLEKGIRLQTDPAVIYGVTKWQGALGRGLRQSELRKKTPYNTYLIEGLPPTPIANPGREAIAAVLNPEKTDFLFFVADGSGGHAFSRTLKEHNRNVARWRKIEAERGNN